MSWGTLLGFALGLVLGTMLVQGGVSLVNWWLDRQRRKARKQLYLLELYNPETGQWETRYENR